MSEQQSQEIVQKVNALDTKVNALDTKVNALDTKVNALYTKVNALDMKLNALDVKMNALNDKIDMTLAEMRDRDNQRHTEIMEIRARQDEERRESNSKFDSAIKHIQTLTVAALVGMGAMFVTLVVFIVTK